MAKIHADTNRADMKTESLEGPRFLKLLAMLPLRTPSSGRAQVFGAMLAATILGRVQGTEMVPASQAVMVLSSPSAKDQVWTTDGDVRIDAGDRVPVRVDWPPCVQGADAAPD
eukprot:9481236-Pyramimonas_sp.AAC.1